MLGKFFCFYCLSFHFYSLQVFVWLVIFQVEESKTTFSCSDSWLAEYHLDFCKLCLHYFILKSVHYISHLLLHGPALLRLSFLDMGFGVLTQQWTWKCLFSSPGTWNWSTSIVLDVKRNWNYTFGLFFFFFLKNSYTWIFIYLWIILSCQYIFTNKILRIVEQKTAVYTFSAFIVHPIVFFSSCSSWLDSCNWISSVMLNSFLFALSSLPMIQIVNHDSLMRCWD